MRLLFPPDIAARLAALSRDAADAVKDGRPHGEGVPPHVTLFTFTASEPPATPTEETGAVSFTGFCRLGAEEGRIWFAVEVEKTPALLEMRERALQKLGRPALQRTDFRPHVTLANMPAEDFDAACRALADSVLARMKDVPCRLSAFSFSS